MKAVKGDVVSIDGKTLRRSHDIASVDFFSSEESELTNKAALVVSMTSF